MKALEMVANKVQQGELSAEEGGRLVMSIVYRNRALFALHTLTEDQLHDFFIFHFKKFIGIFSLYQQEKSSFTSFLYGSIRASLSAYLRKSASKATAEETAMLDYEMNYDEEVPTYATLEPFATLEVNASAKSAKNAKNEGNKNVSYSCVKRKPTREEALKKEICLVLALKCSYYLDDKMIQKISDRTGIPFEKVNAMVLEAKSTLGAKIERREARIKRRDNAWYFRRKYLLESQKIDKGTALAESISQKFSKHSARWQSSTNAYQVVTSNKVVGNLLGMDSRHVFYVLKRAKENEAFLAKAEAAS